MTFIHSFIHSLFLEIGNFWWGKMQRNGTSMSEFTIPATWALGWIVPPSSGDGTTYNARLILSIKGRKMYMAPSSLSTAHSDAQVGSDFTLLAMLCQLIMLAMWGANPALGSCPLPRLPFIVYGSSRAIQISGVLNCLLLICIKLNSGYFMQIRGVQLNRCLTKTHEKSFKLTVVDLKLRQIQQLISHIKSFQKHISVNYFHKIK